MMVMSENGFIVIKVLIILIILVTVFQSTAIFILIYTDLLNGINNNIAKEIDYVTSYYLAEALSEIYQGYFSIVEQFKLNNENLVTIEIFNFGDESFKTLKFKESVRGQTVFILE